MPMIITFETNSSDVNKDSLTTNAHNITTAFNNRVRGVRLEFAGVVNKSFNLFLNADVEPNQIARICLQITDELALAGYTLSITAGPGIAKNHFNPIATDNQLILDNEGIKTDSIECEKYTCAISNQIMDTPVKLPNTTTYVEFNILKKCLMNSNRNPLTGEILNWDENDLIAAVDNTFRDEIDDFVFKLISPKYITMINALINLGNVHESGYMRYEGNPYGHDQQRYASAYKVSLFKTGTTTTVENKWGEMVSQYHQELKLHRLNFPHASKTETALRDSIFAIKTRNTAEFDKIRHCYPNEAGKILLMFANVYSDKYGISQKYCEQSAPRPATLTDDFYINPHREEIGSIEPIFHRPSR